MIEITFKARLLGSIGQLYQCVEYVQNDPRVDEMACREELSNKYEHISKIQIAKPRYMNFIVGS